MPAITSVNLANAIAKLVAADALPALLGNLVVGNLVTKDYEPTIHKEGSAVMFPSNGKNPWIVLRHTSTTFSIPDVMKVLAVPDLLKIYMQPAVSRVSAVIEHELLSLYTGFSALVPFFGAENGSGYDGVLNSIENKLASSTSNVRYLVCDPVVYGILRHVPGFKEYECAGSAGLRALIDGTVGKYRDLFVLQSVNVPKTAVTDVTQNLAFSRSAIGFATRRLSPPSPGTGQICEYAEMGNFGMRVTMQYQPNTLAQDFEISVLHGAGILQQNEGVKVPS